MAPYRFLLDTHCLIWFQDNDPQLSKQALNIIQDPANTIYFSQVSLFEIAIKLRLDKLPDFIATTQDVYDQAIKDGFEFLQIQNEYIFEYQNVPLLKHHKDPFDRLLIATAIKEDTIILSVDEVFDDYRDIVKIIW